MKYDLIQDSIKICDSSDFVTAFNQFKKYYRLSDFTTRLCIIQNNLILFMASAENKLYPLAFEDEGLVLYVQFWKHSEVTDEKHGPFTGFSEAFAFAYSSFIAETFTEGIWVNFYTNRGVVLRLSNRPYIEEGWRLHGS